MVRRPKVGFAHLQSLPNMPAYLPSKLFHLHTHTGFAQVPSLFYNCPDYCHQHGFILKEHAHLSLPPHPVII